MCYLFYWPVHLVCSEGMPAAVGGWDAVMRRWKESRKGWSVGSIEDVGTGRAAAAGALLQC